MVSLRHLPGAIPRNSLSNGVGSLTNALTACCLEAYGEPQFHQYDRPEEQQPRVACTPRLNQCATRRSGGVDFRGLYFCNGGACRRRRRFDRTRRLAGRRGRRCPQRRAACYALPQRIPRGAFRRVDGPHRRFPSSRVFPYRILRNRGAAFRGNASVNTAAVCPTQRGLRLGRDRKPYLKRRLFWVFHGTLKISRSQPLDRLS